MAPPQTTRVLVVGAGPAGLATAVALAKYGLQVVIVDALAEGMNGSRAAVVHAHTLEELDTLGLADALVAEGIAARNIVLRNTLAQEITAMRLDLLQDLTRYPYGLLLSQHNVETILMQHLVKLGVTIFRGLKAVNMTEVADGQLQVNFESGEHILAKYVVGADGSRSLIREQAGIKFLNPNTNKISEHSDNDLQLILADVTLEHPLPDSLLHTEPTGFIGPDGLLIFLPFNDKSASLENQPFRFVATLPPGSNAPQSPTVDYIQQLLVARVPGLHVRVTGVRDGSRYRTRSALVERYYARRANGAHILLVGDAAHIHSPAGGQGMNLGLCDAVKLGAAIAEHVKTGDDALFKKYSDSRRSVALQVIALAERMTSAAAIRNSALAWARDILLGTVTKLPFVTRQMAFRVSGLAYANA